MTDERPIRRERYRNLDVAPILETVEDPWELTSNVGRRPDLEDQAGAARRAVQRATATDAAAAARRALGGDPRRVGRHEVDRALIELGRESARLGRDLVALGERKDRLEDLLGPDTTKEAPMPEANIDLREFAWRLSQSTGIPVAQIDAELRKAGDQDPEQKARETLVELCRRINETRRRATSMSRFEDGESDAIEFRLERPPGTEGDGLVFSREGVTASFGILETFIGGRLMRRVRDHRPPARLTIHLADRKSVV